MEKNGNQKHQTKFQNRKYDLFLKKNLYETGFHKLVQNVLSYIESETKNEVATEVAKYLKR